MRVDCALVATIESAGDAAAEAERLGYGGVCWAETIDNPLLALSLCAGFTKVDLISSVTVAFARTPMALAYDAAALYRLAPGRVILGLGSQIRQSVVKRFGAPYNPPVERMRDYIHAFRAIWASWRTGAPLRYRGPYYRHTYMLDFYRPPLPEGPELPIYLAGVGPRMTELAGEVADGLMFHSLATGKYLRSITIPAIERGECRAGRSARTVTLAGRILLATGFSPEELRGQIANARAEIGFYLTTPTYQRMWAHYGLEALHDEARRLSLLGRWDRVIDFVPDSVVEQLAVVGTPDELPGRIADRFGGLIDRISFPTPPSAHAENAQRWRSVVEAVASIPGRQEPVPPGQAAVVAEPRADVGGGAS